MMCLINARSSTLSGTIKSGKNGLSGVQIEVVHLSSNMVYNTVSDKNGKYMISFLKDGKYKIIVMANGMQSREVNNIYLRNGISDIEIKMVSDSINNKINWNRFNWNFF